MELQVKDQIFFKCTQKVGVQIFSNVLEYKSNYFQYNVTLEVLDKLYFMNRLVSFNYWHITSEKPSRNSGMQSDKGKTARPQLGYFSV